MDKILSFLISIFFLMPFAFASGIPIPVGFFVFPLICLIPILVISFLFLKFVKKNLSLEIFGKFLGSFVWMWVSIWLIFIFLLAFLDIYHSVFLSPRFNEQFPSLISLFAQTCTINYLFFIWKKDFKSWLGFTRVDLLVVSIISFLVNLILLFIWLFCFVLK